MLSAGAVSGVREAERKGFHSSSAITHQNVTEYIRT